MNARRLVVALLLLLLPGGLLAQGLGDVAARERAKRHQDEVRSESAPPTVVEPTPSPEFEPTPATAGEPTPQAAAVERWTEPTAPEPKPFVREPIAEEPRVQAPAPLAPQPPQLLPPEREPFAVRWHGVELHARFLGRASSDRTEDETETGLAAQNIRFELRYRPRPWVRGVLEWDHERMIERDFHLREVRLKDAFLELRPGRFRIRAGQFKSPISPIERESRWELPVSERGLLSDVLDFAFGITGRRPGLELRWNQKGGPLTATAAVQRATSTRGERIGDESFDNVARDWGALTPMARLAWDSRDLEVGAIFSLRPAEPLADEGYQRFWTAGADLSWRAQSRSGPRFWVEGYLGSSWQDWEAFDGGSTRFLAGRLLGAWSFYLREGSSLYLEPFAMMALLEPDTTVRDDLVWEAAGGFHLGAFGHLRLVLEAQRRGVSRNLPPSLGLAPLGGPPASSRTRLVAQIGAAF